MTSDVHTTPASVRPANLVDTAGRRWKQHLLELPPYDSGAHIAPGDRALYQTAIVQARRAGGSTRDIADFLGRSITFVRLSLSTAGEGNTTAVDHVEAILRSHVTDGTYQVGDVLPMTRQLGNELGVPRDAVAGAISRLAHDGIMLSVYGRGTVVTDPRTPPTGRVLHVRTASGAREIWPLRLGPNVQRIRNTVTDRVIDGTYPEGRKIPSAKTLADEFGVNPETVKNAIGPLKSCGLLHCPGARRAGTFVHPKALSRLKSAAPTTF
ncbi:GntR family transcriptional regulator [Streptomyces hokutonensis]|uniref:GntR family transcriptional regulator n=1 Tax=Streptomyces hokutonensis TaxID=1306990 RepID=A0ABW6M5P5_9ACTN